MKQLALVAFLVGAVGLSTATAADKDDPTGTWTWKVKFGEKEFDQTLKLELKDGKLTGSIGGGKQATKIEDATFKDGKIAFSVTRMRKDQKSTSQYTGTVSGDTIKGKVSTKTGDDTKDMDWEAKKAKAKD